MVLAWSSCVMDADGRVLEEVDADRAHSTASVGKLFLLCEVADRIARGDIDPLTPLHRDPALEVADSGLWQHLRQDTLPVGDACVLVAAVSDNWATNVLLDIVGLPAVTERARALGCHHSNLYDRVRDVRTQEHPPLLSTGTARELAEVARRIHASASGEHAQGISPAAGALVEDWLLTGVDLSMVAAAFRLDPLAHTGGPIRLWSKTGFDTVVRADVGTAWTQDEAVSYAAIATWSYGDDVGGTPYERMHALGEGLARRLSPTGAAPPTRRTGSMP